LDGDAIAKALDKPVLEIVGDTVRREDWHLRPFSQQFVLRGRTGTADHDEIGCGLSGEGPPGRGSTSVLGPATSHHTLTRWST
jgi:hypothetical protein